MADMEPFPQTPWSLIVRMQGETEGERMKALQEICQAYWMPLYAFARRSGNDESASADLVQSTFERFQVRDLWDTVDSHKGALRSFLIRILKQVASSNARHDKAQKRGGGLPTISLDGDTIKQAEIVYAARMKGLESPSSAYERAWAERVLEQAMNEVKTRWTHTGRGRRFKAIIPLVTEEREGTYAAVSETLGMTEAALKVGVHRLRHEIKSAFLKQVASTVADPHNEAIVKEEVLYLQRILMGD